MYCTKCGFKVELTDNFCSNCGAPISEEQKQAVLDFNDHDTFFDDIEDDTEEQTEDTNRNLLFWMLVWNYLNSNK